MSLQHDVFDIYNPYGIKLLTRLRLGLSHPSKHKFKNGFNDLINPNCICGGDIEPIHHFSLNSPELALFDNIQSINKILLSQNESSLSHFLTVTLNATPVFMHSFSTQQLNSHYLQEDSMHRYLVKLKIL